MTTQEEWRQIRHQEEMGRRTGNSSGTLAGARGAAKYQAAEAQRTANAKKMKDSFTSALAPRQQYTSTTSTSDLGPETSSSASWETTNTVISLIAIAGLFLYLRFWAAMDMSAAFAFGLFGGLLIGRFYKAILIVATLVGALAIYGWYQRHH